MIGVSRTSLMVGGFRSKALLVIVTGGNWSLNGPLWWGTAVMLSNCSNLRFRNLNSTVPVDVVRVKSYVNSLYNSTRVPVRVSVNKLNFIPERIISGLTGGVLRNGRSLSPWKPYIPIVLLNPFMHAPFPFPFRRFILCHIHKESYTLLHVVFVDQQDP